MRIAARWRAGREGWGGTTDSHRSAIRFALQLPRVRRIVNVYSTGFLLGRSSTLFPLILSRSLVSNILNISVAWLARSSEFPTVSVSLFLTDRWTRNKGFLVNSSLARNARDFRRWCKMLLLEASLANDDAASHGVNRSAVYRFVE